MAKVTDATIATANPLYTKVMAVSSTFWSVNDDEENTEPKQTLSEQINVLFNQLEKKYGQEFVTSALTLMTEMRHGLTDVEVQDLLSSDEALDSINHYTYGETDLYRTPQYLWVSLKMTLQPFLQQSVQQGLVLNVWRHQSFARAVESQYGNIECAKAQNHILDYFEEKLRKEDKTSLETGEAKEISAVRVLKSQKIKFKDVLNRRRFDENTWVLLKQEDKGRLEEEFLLNAEQLCNKLSTCGIYQVLQDIDLLLDQESGNKDMKLLQNILRTSQPVLAKNVEHFSNYLQMLVQAEKITINVEGMKKFQEQLKEIKIPYMDYFGTISLGQENDESSPKVIHASMERIRGDSTHMISVAPTIGEVSVWNIHTQKSIRTIKGLQEPKRVRMLDNARAAVLCGRELRIVNMDEGVLLTKLKGVLHITMPLFEIQDKDHTIALSRNRMYVNIMNNNTGDLDATFKVGEDRFLNSLLVSANGHRCVCGDVVQKPFPLLVWDLQNRKLMHDLRITGHEFITTMSAITHDGHYAISVCRVGFLYYIIQNQPSSSKINVFVLSIKTCIVCLYLVIKYTFSLHLHVKWTYFDILVFSQMFPKYPKICYVMFVTYFTVNVYTI